MGEEKDSSEEEAELTTDPQTCSEEFEAEEESSDVAYHCTEEKIFEILSGTGPEKIVVTRDMLIRGQLEDDTLTQGMEDPSLSYHLKDNILYKRRFGSVVPEGDDQEDEGGGDRDEDGLTTV